MGSASFQINSEILFELIGLNKLDGIVTNVKMVTDNTVEDKSGNKQMYTVLEVSVLGDDIRLPKRENYPKCEVVCRIVRPQYTKVCNHCDAKLIQSHFYIVGASKEEQPPEKLTLPPTNAQASVEVVTEDSCESSK